MSNTFFIRIIATDKIFFEGKILAFIGSSIDGEFEFMAHHEEEIVAVAVGGIRFQTEDGEWHRAICGMGTAQFVNNRCTVLVDTCETAEEIDVRRAEEAKERALEQLRQKQSVGEFKRSQMSLARALTRLEFSSQKKHYI